MRAPVFFAPSLRHLSPWFGKLHDAGFRVLLNTRPDGAVASLLLAMPDGPVFVAVPGETLADAEDTLARRLGAWQTLQLEGKAEHNERVRGAAQQALDLRS